MKDNPRAPVFMFETEMILRDWVTANPIADQAGYQGHLVVYFSDGKRTLFEKTNINDSQNWELVL